MASAESSKPECPVCHQTDQVKTLQSAYNLGVTRCAPPDLPTRNIRMLPHITACILLLGICVFLIITLIGGLENRFPVTLQFILGGLTLISIITALGVSYQSFQRVVKGDNEAAELYPAYDKAMETWNHLSYCSRDDIVFDPEKKNVITNEQLAALHSFTPNDTQAKLSSALA